MDLQKALRYFWYRIGQEAPTSEWRSSALQRLSHIEIGDDSYIGPDITITPFGRDDINQTLLLLGKRVTVSPDVRFLCSMHAENSTLSQIYGEMNPIVVEDDAWIGAGATILAGVTIGRESVVGAGAVVTEDVSSRTVVGGVPAKKLKEVEGL